MGHGTAGLGGNLARASRRTGPEDKLSLETARAPLEAWESFYVIVGSSGAALIGLQFVVMALIAEMEVPSTHASIGAFGTPTIVHFAATLLVSATMSAPWPTVIDAAIVLNVAGIAGVVYVAINARRARRQNDYQPVWEDWLWHAILPIVAYGLLFVGTFMLRTRLVGGLFAVGGVALLLLFIGIHNAWDTVTYLVVDRRQAAKRDTKA